MLSWRRGSVQEVAWLSGGKHAGGYSYRFCSHKFFLQVLLLKVCALTSFSYACYLKLLVQLTFLSTCYAIFNWGQVYNLMHVFFLPRLCPLGKSGKRALTEKCFQRLPLRFLTNKTWIRTLHRSGKVSRCREKKRMQSKTFPTRWRTVKAHRTSLKTFPPGSQWTKVAEPNKGMRTATSNLSKVAR